MKIDLIQATDISGIVEGMKTSRNRQHIENIPEKIFKWRHWSVLEHSSMTIKITGISRACSHQLVRHRIGNTFTQESQRFFDPLENPEWFVMPPRIEENEELKEKYIQSRKQDEEEYYYYRKHNIPKEDARFCLPNACKTSITWTFNMSSLIWFLEMRLSKDAQWEIKLLAEKIYELVMTVPGWNEFLKLWKLGLRR